MIIEFSKMLVRWAVLLAALLWESARAQHGSTGCALIIPQGGSGASLFGHDTDVCITYDDVNSAFFIAKDKVGLPRRSHEFEAQDLGNLATVIQETSRVLAEKYGISKVSAFQLGRLGNMLNMAHTLHTYIHRMPLQTAFR